MTTPAHPASRPAHRPLALVAGASRGLGFLVARELLRREHDVVLASRSLETLERAAADLRREADADARIHVVECDVRERESVTAAVEQVRREHGQIDVAIHVAGIIQAGPAENMTHEHYEQAIGTMLWGPIHLAEAVVPSMRERGSGRFGVVTSVGGMVSPPHLLPYATAKFGAVGFTDGLAASLAGSGATATTIVPGLMRTGSHTAAQFTGDPVKEYSWFAPGASLPLLSIDADRAASRMVEGVLAGKPTVTLTPLTWAAIRFRGAVPATTTRLFGVMNRLLPGAVPQSESVTKPGHEVAGQAPRVVRMLTTLGDRAGRRHHEP